jgi:hypothetical protein
MAALLLPPIIVYSRSGARPLSSALHSTFRRPFFGSFVPLAPHRVCSTPHTEKRSPFVVSLSLHFGACKPIQARLRLRACMQRSCFFGRNSLSGALSPKFRYRLPPLYVLATSFPRNPYFVAPFGRVVLNRGSAASVIRLAAVPLGCCARLFALVPASFGRANSHKQTRLRSSTASCVLPILPLVVQAAHSRTHNGGRPRRSVSLRYTLRLSVSPSHGELAAARRDKPRLVFRLSYAKAKSDPQGDYLRHDLVLFLIFLVLFSFFLNTLF